jgi:hypothetical protein
MLIAQYLKACGVDLPSSLDIDDVKTYYLWAKLGNNIHRRVEDKSWRGFELKRILPTFVEIGYHDFIPQEVASVSIDKTRVKENGEPVYKLTSNGRTWKAHYIAIPRADWDSERTRNFYGWVAIEQNSHDERLRKLEGDSIENISWQIANGLGPKFDFSILSW